MTTYEPANNNSDIGNGFLRRANTNSVCGVVLPWEGTNYFVSILVQAISVIDVKLSEGREPEELDALQVERNLFDELIDELINPPGGYECIFTEKHSQLLEAAYAVMKENQEEVDTAYISIQQMLAPEAA